MAESVDANKLRLIDTHCHIHDSEFQTKYDETPEQLLANAREVGVDRMICVGTDLRSSQEAVAFAESHIGCFASLGIHPHEAEKLTSEELKQQLNGLQKLHSEKIVAVGECGLDYFYHSDDEVLELQADLFQAQLQLARARNLPMIFHVRNAKGTDGQKHNAFSDFLKLIDHYRPEGVVHSFSATVTEMYELLQRGLYVGFNGIMTFTNDIAQLQAAKEAPVDRILLETDAPFLTPAPFRGTMCEPKHVMNITEFMVQLREQGLEAFAHSTTANAERLFKV